jgi:hypothetical protein
MPGFPGPGLTPITNGTAAVPGLGATPAVAPPAPIMTAPAGPNPGLAEPPHVPTQAAALENTTAFDPDQAELRWQDNRWQLAAGNIFLKDFGRYETEGREVLRVVRTLRLNTLTTIGSPRPIMEYWLSNGKAPQGRVDGLRTLPIDPAALSAEQVQGQWCVHDANRILFNFGQQGDACRHALAVIQRYSFTQVGYVGQVAPVMLVFLANAPASPVTPVSAQVPQTSQSHLPDVRFPHVFGNGNTPGQQPGALPNAPAAPGQQPGATPNAPSQPGAMPNVSSQPLNPAAGMPLKQPGTLAQVGLRMRGAESADRVAIDVRQLVVRRDGNDWKLLMGNHVVANFGPNQADAQMAQAALRQYGCTEQVFVGNPRPVFSYFLSNGQAPHGTSYAFNSVSFRPESLSVRQYGAGYVLYDGTQIVMSFGDRLTEAQQALQVIQQHKFDRLNTFGRGDQSMMLFVRTN